MQIDKRNRTELKQYFAKNAIPTDSNFAELIDGMLNQRDDGIVKLPNDPLSIEAAGDATSQKKAIHFYTSFGDPDPTWVLSLNPRQNPADAATATAGFSISDSAGNSRLFIDRTTGKIGIGTTNPRSTLTVGGGITVDGNVECTDAVVPSVGNVATKGIQFPSNPGGGSGDEAFIRYYPVAGEACKLMIGINNDFNDTIGLWQAGAERMTVTSSGIKVNGSISGGETATGWVLGGGGATDNWLRLTVNAGAGPYHDLAVNHFWSAGLQRFDLAEVTPVCADDQLEQGDVVVIDREDGARVRRSMRPYDPAVYGIVSSYHQAAMVIGGFGGPEQMIHAKDKLPIALVGRVKIKVCGEAGPIRVGDLLTTSSVPGRAMRCADPAGHPGAVVGKALEPFSGETGTITALAALQ